jgi:hypothetical protein
MKHSWLKRNLKLRLKTRSRKSQSQLRSTDSWTDLQLSESQELKQRSDRISSFCGWRVKRVICVEEYRRYRCLLWCFKSCVSLWMLMKAFINEISCKISSNDQAHNSSFFRLILRSLFLWFFDSAFDCQDVVMPKNFERREENEKESMCSMKFLCSFWVAKCSDLLNLSSYFFTL